MAIRKQIGYRYFYGSCIGNLIFILVITFNYIKLFDFMVACGEILIIFYISWRYKQKSNLLTKEFMEKKKYRNIFIDRCQIVCWLFVLYFLTGLFNLVIFFHEIGHLLTAMSFNVKIGEVYISPMIGFVVILEEIPIIQFNIIGFSGGSGVIFVGTLFLFLIHRNDDITLTLRIPMISIILYAICSNLVYFWDGALSIPNNTDMGLILQKNPNLDSSLILYFTLFWFILVIIFSLASIGTKMVSKIRFIVDDVYPDLSFFTYNDILQR